MDIAYNKVDQTALPIDVNRVSASEYNQIAGSLMSIISASGLTPDSADNTQLLNALKVIGSGWSMPSSTYEDLTPGASGASYTAPANGYVTVDITANNNNAWALIVCNGVGQHCFWPTSGGGTRAHISVKKGASFAISYSNGTINKVRFVYAEGSKSEAN